MVSGWLLGERKGTETDWDRSIQDVVNYWPFVLLQPLKLKRERKKEPIRLKKYQKVPYKSRMRDAASISIFFV